jgi:hypothetical protein
LTLQDLFALYSDLDAHVLDFGPYVFYPTSKIGSSVHDAASAVAMCGRIFRSTGGYRDGEKERRKNILSDER